MNYKFVRKNNHVSLFFNLLVHCIS